MSDEFYESWILDAPWGCGWVATCNRRVVASAPIFRKLNGWDLHLMPPSHKFEKLCDETEESVSALSTFRPRPPLKTVAEWLQLGGQPNLRRVR